jgi:hypothetical protein
VTPGPSGSVTIGDIRQDVAVHARKMPDKERRPITCGRLLFGRRASRGDL